MGIGIKKYLLVTDKSWHDPLFRDLKKNVPGIWKRIKRKEAFTFNALKRFKPDWVFIPHWSHIISGEVHNNFKCVVFHMTDLPYGRGGSPLQNLIVRGYKKTKISAIKVAEGIDTGEVYLKKDLSLKGTAEEIFVRSAKVIGSMIEKMTTRSIQPQPQKGTPVVFKRRKPEQGNLTELSSFKEVYDHIRMLDCEGYPSAFLETNFFLFHFTKAQLNSNKSISANVKITKK